MLYSFCGMPVGRSDNLSRLEGVRQESGARARMQHPTLVYARSDDSMHLVTTYAPGELLPEARGERSTDERSDLRVGLSWFFVGLSSFFVGLSSFFVGLSSFFVGLSSFFVGLSVGENNVPIAFDFASGLLKSLLHLMPNRTVI